MWVIGVEGSRVEVEEDKSVQRKMSGVRDCQSRGLRLNGEQLEVLKGVNGCDVGEQSLEGSAEIPDGGGGWVDDGIKRGEEDPALHWLCGRAKGLSELLAIGGEFEVGEG